jgi:hypothetical protein
MQVRGHSLVAFLIIGANTDRINLEAKLPVALRTRACTERTTHAMIT